VRLVGYTRVSRGGKRDATSERFITEKEQRRQVKAYAEAHGHEVVAWFADKDESGGKASRPEFDLALAMVERGDADGLIVAKLDRFMRSLSHGVATIERIEKQWGRKFVSVTESSDTSTASGRLILNVLMSFAEFERERQQEAWEIAKRSAIGRGVYISATPPFGYDRDENGRLHPNADAKAVRRVFKERARGASWNKCADVLDRLAPKASGGNWTRQTVERVITNRAYLGEAKQGEVVNPDAHQALVDEATWLLAQPSVLGPREEPASKSLLSGLLVCGTCGRPMSRVDTRSYGCRSRRATAERCPRPTTVSVRGADEAVLDWFCSHAALRVVDGKDGAVADVRKLMAVLDEARAELDDFLSRPSRGIAPEVWQRAVDARTAAVDEARRAVAEAKPKAVVLHIDGPDMVRIAIEKADQEERRRMLAQRLDGVVVAPVESGARNVASRLKVEWR
jgi:DNA invertase Pin-like site-specific DNA recombinase